MLCVSTVDFFRSKRVPYALFNVFVFTVKKCKNLFLTILMQKNFRLLFGLYFWPQTHILTSSLWRISVHILTPDNLLTMSLIEELHLFFYSVIYNFQLQTSIFTIFPVKWPIVLTLFRPLLPFVINCTLNVFSIINEMTIYSVHWDV